MSARATSKTRPPERESPQPSDPPSVLGRALNIWGRLESTGEVRVHGAIAGDINAPKVTLCPDGYVKGNILAGEVHLYGHLDGNTVARTVVVGPNATIEGQVFYNKIDMAKGNHVNARFPWRPANYFEQFDEQLQQHR